MWRFNFQHNKATQRLTATLSLPIVSFSVDHLFSEVVIRVIGKTSEKIKIFLTFFSPLDSVSRYTDWIVFFFFQNLA